MEQEFSRSQLGRLQQLSLIIDQACDGKMKTESDIAKNIQICDQLNRTPVFSPACMRMIRKKLKSENLRTVILTLGLLDVMAKNVPSSIEPMASPDFMRTLTKIATDQRARTKEKLLSRFKKKDASEQSKKATCMEKSKLLIQALGECLGHDERFLIFGAVYNKLKRSGVRFPVRTKNESGEIPIPPKKRRVVPSPYGSPGPGRSFGQPRSPAPAPPRAVFPVIRFAVPKSDAKDIEPKHDFKIKTSSQVLTNAQDLAIALHEMLMATDGSASSLELVAQFQANLMTAQEKLGAMIISTENTALVDEALQVNELIVAVQDDLKGLQDGSRKVPKDKGQGLTPGGKKESEEDPPAEPKQKDLLNFDDFEKKEASDPKVVFTVDTSKSSSEESPRLSVDSYNPHGEGVPPPRKESENALMPPSAVPKRKKRSPKRQQKPMLNLLQVAEPQSQAGSAPQSGKPPPDANALPDLLAFAAAPKRGGDVDDLMAFMSPAQPQVNTANSALSAPVSGRLAAATRDDNPFGAPLSAGQQQADPFASANQSKASDPFSAFDVSLSSKPQAAASKSTGATPNAFAHFGLQPPQPKPPAHTASSHDPFAGLGLPRQANRPPARTAPTTPARQQQNAMRRPAARQKVDPFAAFDATPAATRGATIGSEAVNPFGGFESPPNKPAKKPAADDPFAIFNT